MIKRIAIYASLLLSCAFLNGCTSLTPQTLSVQQQNLHQRSPKSQAAALKKLTHWNIDGAFSLSQKNQHIIANYQWSHTPSQFTLRIYAGLNLASVTITGTEAQVSLTDTQGQHFTASTIKILMQKALGWQLPIKGLRYWIKGLAAPGNYQAKYGHYGTLSTLHQSGWNITYSRYQRQGIYDLPNIIRIQGHNTHIKLIIKHWNAIND
jgi:outer membrane lipoprotein LolB